MKRKLHKWEEKLNKDYFVDEDGKIVNVDSYRICKNCGLKKINIKRVYHEYTTTYIIDVVYYENNLFLSRDRLPFPCIENNTFLKEDDFKMK